MYGNYFKMQRFLLLGFEWRGFFFHVLFSFICDMFYSSGKRVKYSSIIMLSTKMRYADAQNRLYFAGFV